LVKTAPAPSPPASEKGTPSASEAATRDDLVGVVSTAPGRPDPGMAEQPRDRHAPDSPEPNIGESLQAPAAVRMVRERPGANRFAAAPPIRVEEFPAFSVAALKAALCAARFPECRLPK
jgi:hypothetical protein